MTNTHTLEIYKDRKKEWRWRLRARNGKIVADSGEGYKRKATMLRSFKRVCVAIYDVSYRVVHK